MKERIVLSVAGLLLIVHAYGAIARPLLQPWVRLPSILGGVTEQTIVFVLFSLALAGYALGWRHTVVLFMLSTVVSWGLEEAGVATGLIYGGYHYTDALGMKLGHVPLLIPLSWFMMIFPSYVLTNCLVADHPVGTRGGLRWIAWIAFVSAVVMTARDLVIDPQLSRPGVGAWVWDQGGEYFGVPAMNFWGWILTSFLVFLPYRLLESRVPLRPLGPTTRTIATMALAMYGVLMISGSANGHVPALKVIAPFVMGLPLIAALTRVWSAAGRRPLSFP